VCVGSDATRRIWPWCWDVTGGAEETSRSSK